MKVIVVQWAPKKCMKKCDTRAELYSSLQKQMSPFNALSGEEQEERLYSQAGFFESTGNFSDPESHFTFVVFTFKIDVLIVFKIIQ